jgi:hypothetical protein
MKKRTFLALAILALLPVIPAMAFERGEGGNGGGRGDGGGGWGNSSRDSGSSIQDRGNGGSNNQGRSNRKINKSKPQSRGQNRGGYPQSQSNAVHHFNGSNSINRGYSTAGGNNYSQSESIHHFGNTNTGSYSNSRVSGGTELNAQHHVVLSSQARSLGVGSAPQAFTNRHQLMSVNRTHIALPRPVSGPQGSALHASVIPRTAMTGSVVRSQMAVVGRAQVTAQINVFNRTEVVPNHYYWHTYNGWNYCHYYDPYGYHWYGWYVGGSCFWSRYWGGNWWWWDPTYYHWCYWHDGWWWWQDPANVDVVYVYDNGSYVNAGSVGETASASAPSESPSGEGMQAPAPSSADNSTSTNMAAKPLSPLSVDKVVNSKDGTRQVKIVGGDAFLYDTVAEDNDSKPVFLSDNVKDIKFISGNAGAPPRVMVTLTDGTLQTYDSDGNLIQGTDQSGA